MLNIELSDKGFLKIVNAGSDKIIVWKIELVYYITVTPLDQISQEQRYLKKQITETIDKNKELEPGGALLYYTKLPKDAIEEVNVYYQIGNMFKKETYKTRR
ncbi:hypothetical protein [Fervidicoccus fontis]|uniref:hypothetical protein n=1 Tax=Fervidicoccus fontis TaxID=683846 RepID=UPI0011E5825C|nr:hypothetical protein [Fervidicoccus fontis]